MEEVSFKNKIYAEIRVGLEWQQFDETSEFLLHLEEYLKMALSEIKEEMKK
jgi:hypothetical protein